MATTTGGSTGTRARDAVLVVLGAASLGVARLVPPDRVADGPVLCPFRLLTGVPCPTCGMTRSWVHTAHGQWTEAFSEHALGPAAVLFVLVASLLLVAHLVTRRWWVQPRLLTLTLVGLCVGIGVFGVLRWFAPDLLA